MECAANISHIGKTASHFLHESMNIKILHDLGKIEPQLWNSLEGTDNPFLRHEFLHALESQGCIHPENGWQPFHLLLYQEQRLLAAAPAYLKGHSWGEFVFDWSWANAHEQHGLNYYPKLIIAAPYSPVTGPRALTATGTDRELSVSLLAQAARQLVTDNEFSSVHWLFPKQELATALQAEEYSLRVGCQFHWTNQDYGDFDDFLARFTSKKRKNLRQERRRVQEAGFEFDWLHGDEAQEADWLKFEQFYRDTVLAHGNVPILNAGFFSEIGKRLGDRVLLIQAKQQGEVVAGALCLRSDDTLYGRYWGSQVEQTGLHFETCYYQGIDYCIQHGIARFEPGAQGEHKVARGFMPTMTHSAHWIRNTALRQAIGDFLDREHAHVEAYMRHMTAQGPYRQS